MIIGMRIEIHPGEGGADAEAFAAQLADAVSVHFGRPVNTDGRLLTLDRL